MSAKIEDPAQWVIDQRPMWKRADDLLGGTDAMRAAGLAHLPQFAQEPDPAYKTRLNASVLTNFYRVMAQNIAGVMTSEAVTVSKDCKLPPEFLTNVDRQGRDLNAFVAHHLMTLLTKGALHILTDYPKNPGVATMEDQTRLGLRPYWAAISPDAIIDAITERESGSERLVHVRWLESAAISNGWGRTTRQTIRVLRWGAASDQDPTVGARVEVWQRDGNEAFTEVVTERTALTPERGTQLTELTFAAILADRRQEWTSIAPLDDVAHKNIEHWRSSSDQRNILTLSRFPIRYEIGTGSPAKLVGPGVCLHSTGRTDEKKQNVEFGYIEPEGTGIDAGDRDLKNIAEDIEALGIRLFSKPQQRTVADAEADAARDMSPLQRVASVLQDGLTRALRHAAMWYGMPAEQGGSAVVPKDFGLSADDAKAIEAMMKMRQAGDLSQLTLWAEMRARGYLKTKFTDEDEAARLEIERARDGMDGAETGDDPPVEE